MSKIGEDTAPDIHGDDSYRAATAVRIGGKYIVFSYPKNQYTNKVSKTQSPFILF